MTKYNISLTEQELDRIWYGFNEELKAHKDNIKKGYTGYESCLEDTKLVLKKLKHFFVKN